MVTELSESAVKRAFISGKTNNEVLEYFGKKRRKFLTRDESIAEIDRRYYPVAKFHIKNIREDLRRDYAYVNLNTGELYYVKNHAVRTGSSAIRRILELTADARNALFNLMKEKSMEIERLGSKDIADTLARKDLARIYSIRKPTLTEIILEEILSVVKTFATGKAITSNIPVVEKKRIRKNIKAIKINKSCNLDNFMDTRIPEHGFDPDKITYKPEDVIETLARLLKRDVVYEDTVYLPYYKCRYVTRKGARYLNRLSPKFRGQEISESENSPPD